MVTETTSTHFQSLRVPLLFALRAVVKASAECNGDQGNADLDDALRKVTQLCDVYSKALIADA